MAFELAESTAVTITNANPRRELHGDEKVRAIDISFTLKGENILLDLLEPGLREHHYFNKAVKDGQVALPGVLIPLPNLRHPLLPTSFEYARKQRWRGYRFIWDWGIEGARVDFSDAVLTGLHYDLFEGGSVTIKGKVQYNGDELLDNDLFGELSGLAAEGEIYIKLLAPAELLQAKKGYRAGKPDTPASQPDNEDQQELREEGEDEPPTDPNHPVNQTPEDAFAAAVTGEPA
ncbi:hypothetical protein [Delftia sp. PE138]|uniref:hypothetical protein n=1 Tax=Delftia sp. PE138 TaxID=1812483 RepID=UPI001BAFB888|nr:hypothetical protein [Delftia sp. PE138]MBS3721191.1 hypothetical protein [Delftia sp. PE138]